MTIYGIITALGNAMASLVLGFAVLVKSQRKSVNLPFAVFAFSVALWSVFYACWLLAGSAEAAMQWVKILSCAAIMVPTAFFHFVSRFTEAENRSWLVVGYVLSLGFAALSFTDYICRGVRPFMGFEFWPEAGKLYWAYVLHFGAFTVSSLVMLVIAYGRATHARRNQIKFVLWGTAIGFVGGCTNFFGWFGIAVPPFGNGLVAVYVIGVGYAIIRFRLTEVNYVITKGAAYLLVSLPFSLVFPGIFLALYGIVGDVWQSAFGFLIASCVLTMSAFMLVPRLKQRVDSILDSTLLRPYVTARERLGNLVFDVSALQDEAQIFEVSTGVVSDALEAFAVFYVRSEFDSDIKKRSAFGVPAGMNLPETIGTDSVLIRLLSAKNRATVLDEVEVTDPQLWDEVKEEKHRLGLEVAVPVRAEGIFYGVLGLGRRARNEIFTDQHLYLLDSICMRIGLHVRARQIERRASQAEKLISLGTLAAGLAHELRNPLVSIKTFAALLEENADERDIQREFRGAVLRDVSRVESIVENVSAFATDKKATFSWVRLAEVVRAAYEIAGPSFIDANIGFEFQSAPVPPVRGSHNQLTQVVLNLLNNAVQAFVGRSSGQVMVRLRRRVSDVFTESVELTISDNGPGILPEVLSRLFEPFSTTKDTGDRETRTGMGLGLAIVKRIVDGHNGLIRAESEPGRGTVFTILLPISNPNEIQHQIQP